MLDYRPDAPPDSPSILLQANFVFPNKSGDYQTSYTASAVTNWNSLTLNAACTGARMVRKSDGTPFVFFGSASRIEEINGSTLTNVSKVGGYTSGSNRWWFEQFGDVTVACNYADATQSRSGATGTAFADLTNAPKAKVIISQKGHLLAFNYDDGSASPAGVKWSSQGSSTTWAAAAGNSAGTAQLRETPGEIVAAASIHDVVVAWKRTSMYVGRRVGGSEIWQFNLLSPLIGCLGMEAWVNTPAGIIFVSNSGVYLFDGSVPRRLDRGVWLRIYRAFATLGNVAMSHDEAAGVVYLWTRSTAGNCFAYSYLQDKWSLPYTTALGNASFTTMVAAIRDAQYDDYISVGGTTDTNRRCHLIVTSEKKVCNLSANDTTFTPSFVWQNVRDPKAGPRDDTTLQRVQPIWGYDAEAGVFGEPALNGSLSVTPRTRMSGGALTVVSSTIDSQKGFDLQSTANTFACQMSFTNESIVLRDLSFDTLKGGRR